MKDSTQIIIAIIGISVPAATLFLTFYGRDKPATVQQATTTSQPPATIVGPQQSPPPVGPQPDTTSAPPTTGPATAQPTGPASIAGRWNDADDDYRYVFTQDAASFRYSASEGGQDRGGGGGTIVGRTLIYDFQSADGPGSCRATLADDGRSIGGSCTRGADTFPVRLRRPPVLISPALLKPKFLVHP